MNKEISQPNDYVNLKYTSRRLTSLENEDLTNIFESCSYPDYMVETALAILNLRLCGDDYFVNGRSTIFFGDPNDPAVQHLEVIFQTIYSPDNWQSFTHEGSRFLVFGPVVPEVIQVCAEQNAAKIRHAGFHHPKMLCIYWIAACPWLWDRSA